MNVNDLLTKSATKLKPRKPLGPLLTPDGTIVPETPHDQATLPGEQIPQAVQSERRRNDPFFGKKCSVSGCREGVQWSFGGGFASGFEMPVEPASWSNDPLVAQIEAKVRHARAGVQVPVNETLYMCIRHYSDFMEARHVKVTADRKARETPSWPLYTLNWDGAKIELLDGRYFRLTDGDGKVMKLEVVMSLAECTARLNSKDYVTQVLTADEVRDYKLAAKAQEWTKTLGPEDTFVAVASKAMKS